VFTIERYDTIRCEINRPVFQGDSSHR
jgi:hypothetical protein